jgi:hypothetical protein
MCDTCRKLEAANQAMEHVTNARQLHAVVQDLVSNGIPVPPELASMVGRMANMEKILEENPEATVEQKASLVIDTTMQMNGPALDQEFSEFRDKAWEMVDTAGSIAVVEQDSTKRWLKMGMEVVRGSRNLIEVMGMYTALLAELGRQPELVAQIKERNARFLDD